VRFTATADSSIETEADSFFSFLEHVHRRMPREIGITSVRNNFFIKGILEVVYGFL